MNDNNLFDLVNLEDLTNEDLKEEIKKRREDPFLDCIYSILNIAQKLGKIELSIDEIAVATERKYNLGKNRGQYVSKIYSITKLPESKLVRIEGKSGIYKLI